MTRGTRGPGHPWRVYIDLHPVRKCLAVMIALVPVVADRRSLRGCGETDYRQAKGQIRLLPVGTTARSTVTYGTETALCSSGKAPTAWDS